MGKKICMEEHLIDNDMTNGGHVAAFQYVSERPATEQFDPINSEGKSDCLQCQLIGTSDTKLQRKGVNYECFHTSP